MPVIRPLTHADVPAAQRLRQQAGWNQADDDWRRLLGWDPAGCWAVGIEGPHGRHSVGTSAQPMFAPRSGEGPHGRNVAEEGGEVVGTTAVTSYGQRIAWVGMVLVDEAHRRQGIGRALLTHALDYLDRRGVQTVALDSTPEGQPLYASLGFADTFELARWRGPLPKHLTLQPSHLAGEEEQEVCASSSPAGRERRPGGRGDQGAPWWDEEGTSATCPGSQATVRTFTPADLPAVSAYDARLFGVERNHILAALQAAEGAGTVLAERHGTIVGYALSRPGARAWHLGPLAADDPATAERLAWAAIGPLTGAGAFPELVFDAVMPNQHAVTLAQTLGLAPVRRFIRMTRGAPPPSVDLARLYTSAGPELG